MDLKLIFPGAVETLLIAKSEYNISPNVKNLPRDFSDS